MDAPLLVLVLLLAATLVATLSFLGCSQLRRTPLDVVLDPGSVQGVTAVRFLVTLPGLPLVTAEGRLAGDPARWILDLETAPDGDWRIRCEVRRGDRLDTTPEVTRRVPPRPVLLRLVEEAGSLRVEPDSSTPMPMRVPVTFALDTSGRGTATVDSAAWEETSPMPSMLTGTVGGPGFVSMPVLHEANAQVTVACTCRVSPRLAPPTNLTSPPTTRPVGTAPTTFTFRVVEEGGTPPTYRIDPPA